MDLDFKTDITRDFVGGEGWGEGEQRVHGSPLTPTLSPINSTGKPLQKVPSLGDAGERGPGRVLWTYVQEQGALPWAKMCGPFRACSCHSLYRIHYKNFQFNLVHKVGRASTATNSRLGSRATRLTAVVGS